MAISSSNGNNISDLGFGTNRLAYAFSGTRSDIDQAEVTVWDGDADRYVFPLNTGEPMEIVSTDAADTTQSIVVTGLDSNFKTLNEFVFLNGTTPVSLVNNFTRINRVINFSAEGNELNGRVLITGTGARSGNQYATIEVGNEQALQAVYTVPIDRRSKPKDILLTVNETGSTDVLTYSFYVGTPGFVKFKVITIDISNRANSSFYSQLDAIPALPGGTDFEITAQGSSNNLQGSAYVGFEEILI